MSVFVADHSAKPWSSCHRYAYSSNGGGEEFNDEEVQSLTRPKSAGDVSLVEQGKVTRDGGNGDVYDSEDDDIQPGKGE